MIFILNYLKLHEKHLNNIDFFNIFIQFLDLIKLKLIFIYLIMIYLVLLTIDQKAELC